MSERYIRQFLLPDGIYASGAPVVVSAGALLKDSHTGHLLAQLKLRNISPKSLQTVTLEIFPQYPDGRTGAAVSLILSAQDVPRDGEFGQKTPAFLPENSAFAFSVRVQKVLFADGTVWSGSSTPLVPLTAPRMLEDAYGSEELADQYRRTFGEQCRYMPEITDDFWYCACGSINQPEEPICYSCGLELAAARPAAGDLAAALETRRTAEAERSKKLKKYILLSTLALVVVVAAAILISGAVKKNNAYKHAVELFTNGQYELAETALIELGDYKDCPELLADIPYQEATLLLNEGRLDEAREAFLTLGDYKDSAAIAADIPYQQAVALLEAGKLDEARSAFTALGEYKDSKTYLADIPYLEAHVLLDNGLLDEALTAFQALGSYKDSAEIAEDIPYQKAMRYMEKGAYQEALDIFQTLGSYKDSQEQAVKAIQELCDHAYSSAVTKEPNCTETGIRLYTCEKCAKTYEEDIPIKHEYSSSVTRAATCAKEGERTTVCSVCGDTQISSIATLPHTWVSATCTTPKTCSACKKTEGSPLPHNYAAATCLVPKTCVDCGATTGTVAAHNYAPATCEDPPTCRVCSATTGSPSGHKWNAATCSKPQTCRVCGDTQGSTLDHNFYSGSNYTGLCSACRTSDSKWKRHIDLDYDSTVVNGFQIVDCTAYSSGRASYWMEFEIVVEVQRVEESDVRSVRVRSSGDSFFASSVNAGSYSVGDTITFSDDGYFYGDRSYYFSLSAY